MEPASSPARRGGDGGRALVHPEAAPAVQLRLQTTAQRRTGMAVMAGGLTLILVGLPLGSPLVAGALGGAVGLLSAQVRSAGRHRLDRQIARLADPATRPAALAALERLATSSRAVVTAARVEAAGHVALDRLEAGELDPAVEIVHRAARDLGRRERQRTPRMGFLGEAVRSVLARLQPDALADPVPLSAIAHDAASTERPHADFELVALALRVLEALAEGATTTALRAWSDLSAHPRSIHHPALVTLVGATLVEQVDADTSLTEALVVRLDRLPEAPRAMVLAARPRLALALRQGYRDPATPDPEETALMPTALRHLAPRTEPSRWLPVLPRRTRWLMGAVVGTYTLVALVAAASVPSASVLITGACAILFVPTVLGAPLHRRQRRRHLARLGLLEGKHDPRRAELDAMPARGGPRRGDGATLFPLDAGELRFLVSLRETEAALARGDHEGARAWICWWLEGAAETGLDGISPVAAGASALRVAALLGHAAAVARIDADIEAASGDPRVRTPSARRRTALGDAPQALALARALRLALDGASIPAAAALREAHTRPEVHLAPFDRRLYGALARRLSAGGEVVPERWLGLALREEELEAFAPRYSSPSSWPS